MVRTSMSTNLISVFIFCRDFTGQIIESEMNSPTTHPKEIVFSVSTRDSVGPNINFSLHFVLVCVLESGWAGMRMYGTKYGYSQGLRKGFAKASPMILSWNLGGGGTLEGLSEVGVSKNTKVPAFQPLKDDHSLI